MKEKCVSYVRVSTTNQDYENQQYHIDKYIEFQELTNVKKFGEVISGAIVGEKRDEFSKLKEYLKSHSGIKHLIVNELSRLGRNVEDVLKNVREFTEKGICLHIRDKEIRTLDKDGRINTTTKLLINILAMVDEMEKEQIKIRFREGKLQSVLVNKQWAGGTPPFGFDTNERFQLIPHPDRAEIVVKMFEMYRDGYSTVKIADWLNSKNIKTRYGKSQWKETSLREMLRNPIYTGKRKFKGESIDCPRIVTDELFNVVNERMDTIPNQKGKKKYNYIIDNRIVKCGVCGENFVYINRGTDKGMKCNTYRYKHRCDNYGIGIAKLYNALYHHISTCEYIKNSEGKEREKENIKLQIKSLKDDINIHAKDLQSIDKLRAKTKELFVLEVIDKNELLQRMNEIESKESKSTYIINESKSKIRELESIDLDMKYDFATMNKERVNLLVKELVKMVEVYPVFKGGEFLYTRKSDFVTLVKVYLKNSVEPSILIFTRFSNICYAWTPEIDLANDVINLGNNDSNSFDFEKYELTVEEAIKKSIVEDGNLMSNLWLNDYQEYWDYTK